MTLREAQKLWDDAIVTTITYKPGTMTEDGLKPLGQHWNTPAKILFMKIGKCSSRIISSRLAYESEQRQLVEL
ncbi:hypothetical protein EZS27_000349 [termite gut metagenome]|uniref:Uncharacterized protein n=1 Tax=termite gut metagenome TaxID=433724 RepID=A0A5J4T1L4_9ZZZZ